MTDFLEDKRAEIAARMKKIKPLVDEHNRLEAAAQALDGITYPPAAANGLRRGPGRPPGSKSTKAAKHTAKAAAAKPARRKPAAKAAAAKPAGQAQARPAQRVG